MHCHQHDDKCKYEDISMVLLCSWVISSMTVNRLQLENPTQHQPQQECQPIFPPLLRYTIEVTEQYKNTHPMVDSYHQRVHQDQKQRLLQLTLPQGVRDYIKVLVGYY